MNQMPKRGRITIFEGPDGSGKSTMARAYAEAMGARYVHFDALPKVGRSLPRLYVEAMLPALMGYCDVVLDRCWLSEYPYAHAFRNGVMRLDEIDIRMLERLAYSAGAIVVRCLPPWENVHATFMERIQDEYLENAEQLMHVYDLYTGMETSLCEVRWDYTQAGPISMMTLPDQVVALSHAIDELRARKCPPHTLGINSAGRLGAPIAIVGKDFADVKDQDMLYQWPFASFSNEGCSRWLTNKFIEAGVPEDRLIWVNADMDPCELIKDCTEIIALGDAASKYLWSVKLDHKKIPHPSSWKRFNHLDEYPLKAILGSVRYNWEILRG